jgi:2-dehydropantoate 2-reductase
LILIVGAGAIGQWLAALLRLRASEEVTLLVRPRQVELLRQGIFLGETPAHCTVVTELAAGAVFSDVIFAVKAYQVAAAASQVQAAGIVAERVWSFQNGVGGEPAVAAAFPNSWFGAMTTTVPVYIDGNRVLPGPKGGLAWSSAGEAGRAPAWLSQLGMACFAVGRVDSLKWSKLMLNLTCNASCALLDALPAQVVEHRRMFDFELECLREVLACLRKAGIPLVELPAYAVPQMAMLAPLPGFVVRRILGSKIKKARGDKPPSLLLDLRAGRSDSEVEVLNGAVVRLGAECGVPTPCNRWLYDALTSVVRGDVLWEQYQGQIDEVSRQALAARNGK